MHRLVMDSSFIYLDDTITKDESGRCVPVRSM